MKTKSEQAFDQELGAALLKLRKDRRLPLKQVAHLTGGEVGVSELSRYERGLHTIPAKRLLAILKAYGLSMHVTRKEPIMGGDIWVKLPFISD